MSTIHCGLFLENYTILFIAHYDNFEYVYVSAFSNIQNMIHDAMKRTFHLYGLNDTNLPRLLAHAPMRLVKPFSLNGLDWFLYSNSLKYWLLVISPITKICCPSISRRLQQTLPIPFLFMYVMMIGTSHSVTSFVHVERCSGFMGNWGGSFPFQTNGCS
jgi:hypothetical protein